MSDAPVPIGDLRCELGESPVWDENTELLAVLDIVALRLTFVTAAGVAVSTVPLPERVTAVVPAATGWLAVHGRTVSRLDVRTGELHRLLALPGQDEPPFNDALCGRDGRLYIGTIDRTGSARGALYSIDAQLRVTTVADGLGAANGIDMSPDGTILYFADTLADRIHREPGEGWDAPHPDGITVDAEGGVWVALWGSGAVHRYSPDGELDRVVSLPSTRVASLAFGGEDLSTLFITTATTLGEPLSGRLFMHRPGVQGLVPTQFAL